jgi:excisionase family DNA binding protein
MAKSDRAVDLRGRVTLSPLEAASAAGVSHTRIYEQIDAGALPAKKLGSRTLILVRDLERWADGLPPVLKEPREAGTEAAAA